MTKHNYNKSSILTTILIIIIYTTYSVITFPINEVPDNDSSPILSPQLDHPDPSFPTLKKIDINLIQQPGEFWEMIRTDDYSDKNSNNRKTFGTMLYLSPVWFNKAYNKF